MLMIAIAVGILVSACTPLVQGADTSAEALAVRETILRSRRIDIEAEYTFDTSQLDTVYINDPRGGELSDEALTLIQAVRHDPTLQKDQVGILDSSKAAIENMKHEYDSYIEELRARQAAGTLNEGDRIVLEIATNGWPTPEPMDADAAAKATQACETYIAAAMQPTPEPAAAYPMPKPMIEGLFHESDDGTPYPIPEPPPPPREVGCPTAIPTQNSVFLPYRGTDPALLPPEEFDIDIYSIEIEGDVARAIVHKRAVTSEYVLVKVDGQWYIAGVKLLKFTP
jgi:hypothetical protein